jgi:subtilisin family serine protease
LLSVKFILRVLPKKTALIVASASVTGFLGCGRSQNTQWAAEAPHSVQETGVLVLDPSEHTQSTLTELLHTKGGRGRVISSPRGLYEIHGVSAADIQDALPSAVVEKNLYVKNLIPGRIASNEGREDVLFLLQDAGTAIDPDRCIDDSEAPTVKVNVLSNKKVTEGVLLRGETVELSLEGSAAHPKHPGVLRHAWVVRAPATSQFGEKVETTERLKFVPDALGGYMVGVVVQDERNVCVVRNLDFVLTANEPYQGPTPARKINAEDLKNFPHLEQIQAPMAWNVSQGTGVKIAIIDSGVHYNHPDLSQNILVNDGEIPGNGIDDDQNGYVDDYLGWDFPNSDAYPYDDDGHGTHVAGLAASAVTGVAPGAKILAIKGLNGFGGGDIGSVAAAIMYAADRGAQIINCSFSGAAREFTILQKAIEYAQTKGAIIVAAAGNGDMFGRGINIDRRPHYPASFTNANIVAVGAVDDQGELTPYSNYGKRTVALVAPGGSAAVQLQSTAYDNVSGELYASMIGTSMAAPVVAGAMATALAIQPTLPISQLFQIAQNVGVKKTSLELKIRSGRVLDVAELVDQVLIQNLTGPMAANLPPKVW